MSEGISQPEAKRRLNVLRGIQYQTAYDQTQKYFIGLGKQQPPLTGDFTGIEFALSGIGYTRFEISSALAGSFWQRSGRDVWNAQTVLFGPAVAEDWNTANSVGIFRHPTDTIADIFGHLETGMGTPIGNYLKFNPGELKIVVSQDAERKSQDLAYKQNGALLGQPYGLPGNNLYIGLGTRLKGDGDIIEFSGGLSDNAPGYDRAPIVVSTSAFSDPGSLRQITNKVEIEFEDAAELWAAVKTFGIYTEPTGGVPWYSNMLPADAIVRRGDNLIVLIDGLTIKE